MLLLGILLSSLLSSRLYHAACCSDPMHAIDLLPMKCHRALCTAILPIASGVVPSDDAVTRAAYCLEVGAASFDVLLPAQKGEHI